MCGIAGFISKKSETDSSLILKKMTDRIRHRGPDGEGHWLTLANNWCVSLGHRRLSIIDLATGGQPLTNAEAEQTITYNGEVYNFQELKIKLESLGLKFKTKSDTEVIVQAYRAYGLASLKMFNGMFAFAIWDKSTQSLLLARDRAGIKPLYYTHLTDGSIVFGSELSEILEYPLTSKKLNPEALTSLFFLDYIHPPHTIINQVYKLEPGHYLIWKDGKIVEKKSYWELKPQKENFKIKISPIEESKLSEEFWERSLSAVRRQLIADVPVGVFLSGGIDSSSIAALAQLNHEKPIQTFSIAFEDQDYDESMFAELVSKQIGSNHTVKKLKEQDLLKVIDKVLPHLDEPLADPSVLPTYLLSELTASKVKVALGGDGGDELWAGYPTYQAHHYAKYFKAVPSVVREKLIAKLVNLIPASDTYQSFEWKLKRFILRWDDDWKSRHFRWMSNTDTPDLEMLFLEFTGIPQSLMKAAAAWSKSKDSINRFLALDFQTYMSGSVLTKVDRASMAHSLEVRPPLLDHELVDWAFSLPSSVKLKDGVGKYIFKSSVRKHLPQGIADRRKKGFAIPLARWMKSSLKSRVDAVLKDSPIWDYRIIRQTQMVKWNNEHQEGKVDRSRPLWAMLVLDAWLRENSVDTP